MDFLFIYSVDVELSRTETYIDRDSMDNKLKYTDTSDFDGTMTNYIYNE